MTVQGREAAQVWRDDEYARAWAARDALSDMLELPRRLAAALVARDRPDTALVVDIASGPGAFLAVLLDAFPAARGCWSDISESMHDQAREALHRFGDRVSFQLGDMADLTDAGIPSGADVIATSRATHHLDRDGLARFYQQAAGRLAPGGWLINLDHFKPAERWHRRYREVRPALYKKPTSGGSSASHHPLTSINDHLDGLADAGFTDVDIAWRAMYTAMFVARRDD